MDIETFKKKYRYTMATPVMKQFLDIKYQHLDCLLLYRMGDFYELFYEDAVTASKILSITLTKRGKTENENINMCGIPHHALENYLRKLLEQDFKIAICEQLETPNEAKERAGHKAIVKREVTRIITPGTIIEDGLTDDQSTNYLASIFINNNQSSICYIDLTTNKIFVTTVIQEYIMHEMARLKPKEILLSEKYAAHSIIPKIKDLGIYISFQVDSIFTYNKAKKIVLDFYKIHSLQAIGDLTNENVISIGSILEYISLTQKSHITCITKPQICNTKEYMCIDNVTRDRLEINTSVSGNKKDSLFYNINNTLSKPGSRLLYSYLSSPLTNIKYISDRLNITNFFYSNMNLNQDIRSYIKELGDVERAVAKLMMNHSRPRDLLIIKNAILIGEKIKTIFTRNGETPHYIETLIEGLSGTHEVHDIINQSIKDETTNILTEGGIIKNEYHPKIKELNDILYNSNLYISNLEKKYREDTKIDSLKISRNNLIGLFIEITSRNIHKINDNKFIHRQTTINSARYVTEELKDLENKIIHAKFSVTNLEQELYSTICSELIYYQNKLINLIRSLSKLDVFCNFAHIARENSYVMPKLTNNLIFHIQEGRHPVVEKSLNLNNISFISNDCNLCENERIGLITGPNMSGKSTFLRQNAIIAIMAHIGSFVPAKSAEIGIIDKIFTRIGSSDNLAKGESTFMIEMLETSAILSQSTKKSLIILDEVGRGTSTYDGVSIAWSIIEYIHNALQSRCLFATHYHELIDMQNSLHSITNYTTSIHEEQNKIIFLHKIIKGSTSKSYGIHVAELAGLPQSVIKRANTLLKEFEKDFINKITTLDKV
ncbi:DNA mismatch repair protein MutS [Rickettsia endosymbiont of Cardiosporidium cionae]|uniref:DNA mismatch repair protein MutS n=1 Tax=Rickettsia endosymbiont of Cardiosporidium cionae TaxID=2777155 RepID=UPI0018945D9C|nr:DNA mismatch repair protein MutS [Rickettsia endosymbiont of Cardiosporidium cionae]KAF8818302.1 DNA mismatch repair protein MutS [Rickettsia endosymbiont of Cardiosporidium cionae]